MCLFRAQVIIAVADTDSECTHAYIDVGLCPIVTSTQTKNIVFIKPLLLHGIWMFLHKLHVLLDVWKSVSCYRRSRFIIIYMHVFYLILVKYYGLTSCSFVSFIVSCAQYSNLSILHTKILNTDQYSHRYLLDCSIRISQKIHVWIDIPVYVTTIVGHMLLFIHSNLLSSCWTL